MVGRTVGKYRVVEQVGRGGMGTVYKAIDETLDRVVAIKVLNADLLEQDSVERFRREAMTLARLNHPRIGAIHELTRDGHDLLMVMEFISGETFEKLIERTAPLPLPHAAMLCVQVLDGLQYAHGAGVVHRDLKPANVIVTPTGDVKIMDFGIARVQGSEHLTSHGFMVGTPAYMAPEQVRGEEVDPRMDLYSIAVVLYRMLTHRLPFTGDTAIAMIHSQLNNPPTPPRQFRLDLPDWMVTTLARGLAKNPADRFQTAVEFRAALEGGLAGKMPIPVVSGNEETIGPMLTPPAMPVPVTATSTSTVRPLTGSQPIASAPSAANAIPPATPKPSQAEPTVTLRAPHLATAGVLLALLVVGIGVLAYVALRRPVAVVAPPAEQQEASIPSGTPDTAAPAPNATAANSAAPSADAAAAPAPATGTTPPAATAAARPATARPAPAAPAATDSSTGRRGAAPSSAPPPLTATSTVGRGAPSTATPAAAPPVADVPPEIFADVKTIIADGTKTREVEALLSLESSSIVVRNRNDSTVLRSLDYRSITAASYIRARRPRGQTGPNITDVPENFGGAGLFGSARHWFTLQTANEFLVLRLEDRNVIRVLAAFETRTGLKVQRNQSN